jgi:hypothetical protein
MSTPWKGLEEEFSNIFHYNIPSAHENEAGWEGLSEAVVTKVREMMATGVTFRRVRIYGPTNGSKADNVMQYVRDLSGPGGVTAGGSLAPELAVVVKAYVGRGPKGGKQFLRKYLHVRVLTGHTGDSEQTRAVAALGSGSRGFYEAKLNSLKEFTVGARLHKLCTPNGKNLPDGSDWETAAYVATRQFRARGKRRPAAAGTT